MSRFIFYEKKKKERENLKVSSVAVEIGILRVGEGNLADFLLLLALFSQGSQFLRLLFAFLQTKPLLKNGSTLKGKTFLPRGIKILSF